MRRFFPNPEPVALRIIPLSPLVVAWLSGHWLLGAAPVLGPSAPGRPATPELLAAADSRWKGLLNRRDKSAESESNNTTSVITPAPPPPRRRREKDSNASLVEQMIGQGRVAISCGRQIASTLPPDDYQACKGSCDEAMAMVPVGAVNVRARCYELLDEEAAQRAERLIHVEGLFLDRYTVTNREYQEFVDDGGYEQM